MRARLTIEELRIVLDRVARREEDDDLLLTVLLEEGEEQQEAILTLADNEPLRTHSTPTLATDVSFFSVLKLF